MSLESLIPTPKKKKKIPTPTPTRARQRPHSSSFLPKTEDVAKQLHELATADPGKYFPDGQHNPWEWWLSRGMALHQAAVKGIVNNHVQGDMFSVSQNWKMWRNKRELNSTIAMVEHVQRIVSQASSTDEAMKALVALFARQFESQSLSECIVVNLMHLYMLMLFCAFPPDQSNNFTTMNWAGVKLASVGAAALLSGAPPPSLCGGNAPVLTWADFPEHALPPSNKWPVHHDWFKTDTDVMWVGACYWSARWGVDSTEDCASWLTHSTKAAYLEILADVQAQLMEKRSEIQTLENKMLAGVSTLTFTTVSFLMQHFNRNDPCADPDA